MSDRPDLSAYLDDELSPEERAVFEAELAIDPDLVAELAAFEELAQTLSDLPRLEAPTSLMSEIMDKILPVSLARAASSMHPEKRGYEGMRARHEHRQKKRRRKRPEGRDPFADDPFGDAAPPPPAPDGSLEATEGSLEGGEALRKPTMEELGPELTAYVDGELAPAEAERITALARRDPRVAREVRHLRRIRSRIASLPRIEAPAHLTAQIMSEIDLLDREEAQRQLRARQARQALFQNLSRFAQAACFLFVVGGGLFLSQPEDHPLAYRSSPRAAGRKAAAPKRAAFWGSKRDRAKTERERKPTASVTLASARVEASWNLSVSDRQGTRSGAVQSGEEGRVGSKALEAAVSRARGLTGLYATRLEPEFKSELDWGRIVEVPANRVDDFCADLEASGEITVPPEVLESLKTLHAEQDRLVLKSGFVLVGRVRRKGREYVIKTGGVIHRVPVSDVAKVEKAEEVRRIRVLIR